MNLVMNRKTVLAAAKTFVTDGAATRSVIQSFFSALDTPKSLAAWLMFSSGEHSQLLDLDLDPASYRTDQGDKFHLDYCAVSFLSKFTGLTTGYDKKARALAKFRLFEEQCKVTNSRFRSYREQENSQYAAWLFVMRRKIDQILGEFNVEEIFDKASWGPGVTTLIKGDDVSATRKFQSEIGITRDAYSLFGTSLEAAYPGWMGASRANEQQLSFQAGNTITTVPKNSKTDRVIAIEPGLNLYFQKGVGKMIKARLKAVGVDLSNQGRNQELARIGVAQGLATVDFSSASDSIATNLVRAVLPSDWWLVLDALRCKVGSMDGQEFAWQKFSSMGNGFTFELESLIFYAAALTACEFVSLSRFPIVSVYGDDVVIPSDAFPAYAKFCSYLGFTVNPEKSFSSGLFRESCGSHYFNGVDTKPIFLKDPLTDAFSVFKLANSIRRLAHRRSFMLGCDRRFLPVWRLTLQWLPNALRSVKVAEGYGDGGILSNFDEACPPQSGNGWQGFRVLTLVQRNAHNEQDCEGLMYERLTQISVGSALTHGRAQSPDDFFRSSLESNAVKLMLGLSTRSRDLVASLRTQACVAFAAVKLEDTSYGGRTASRNSVVLTTANVHVPVWYNLGGWA